MLLEKFSSFHLIFFFCTRISNCPLCKKRVMARHAYPLYLGGDDAIAPENSENQENVVPNDQNNGAATCIAGSESEISILKGELSSLVTLPKSSGQKSCDSIQTSNTRRDDEQFGSCMRSEKANIDGMFMVK